MLEQYQDFPLLSPADVVQVLGAIADSENGISISQVKAALLEACEKRAEKLPHAACSFDTDDLKQVVDATGCPKEGIGYLPQDVQMDILDEVQSRIVEEIDAYFMAENPFVESIRANEYVDAMENGFFD